MVYPHRQVALDPVADAKWIERIEHAKVCDNYSTVENVCLGHPKEKDWCLNCQCYEDGKDIILTKGICQSCSDPKTCENGDDGDRCAGCARSMYELTHDL